MIPDDLKDYRAHSGFELFTPEEARWILAALLALCLLLDRLGVFA